MPPGSAARKVEIPYESRRRAGAAPATERSPHTPRFRVVMRRPLVTAQRRAAGRSMPRALLLAAVPAFCLLAYVLFWTLAIRAAYHRDQLQEQVKLLRIEQAELRAEKRRRQSPGLNLERAARELEMTPAAKREFARLPVPQRVARRPVDR